MTFQQESAVAKLIHSFSGIGYESANYSVTSGTQIDTKYNMDASFQTISFTDPLATDLNIELPIPLNMNTPKKFSILFVRPLDGAIGVQQNINFIPPAPYPASNGFPSYPGGQVNGGGLGVTHTVVRAPNDSNAPFLFYINSNSTQNYLVHLLPHPPKYEAGPGIMFTGLNPVTITATGGGGIPASIEYLPGQGINFTEINPLLFEINTDAPQYVAGTNVTFTGVNPVSINASGGGGGAGALGQLEYNTGGAAGHVVSFSGIGVPSLVNVPTTFTDLGGTFESPGASILRYIGPNSTPHVLHFTFGLKLEVSSTATLHFSLLINGASPFPSTYEIICSGNYVTSVSSQIVLTLNMNDAIQFRATNFNNTVGAAFEYMNVMAIKV